MLFIFYQMYYYMNPMEETNEITQHKDNESLKPNREYKDSVFVDLFALDEKTRYDAVIPFYNEFHNKKVSSKEEIRFVRLENVLFRKVRNDVSFVANNRLLLLLEHQSTINVNMPFRCLEYAISLYQKELGAKDKFSQKPISLFAPEFYVIYNGKAPYPARKELRLSDLFKDSEKPPQLEAKVIVININHPDNKGFLDACYILRGYGKLSERIKTYTELYGERGYAMAIEECIRERMELVDYLKRKMREVAQMFSAEYSYALELEASKEDGMREGMAIGMERGMERGMEKGIERGREEGRMARTLTLARSFRDMGVSLDKIAQATGLSEDEIKTL